MNKFFVLGMAVVLTVSMIPMNGQEEILLKIGCQPIDKYIDVDGDSFCIGDPITVYIFVPSTGEVTVFDEMTSGEIKIIFQQTQSCGEDYWYSSVRYVEGPPGTEILRYVAQMGCCPDECPENYITDHVSFTIEDCLCEEWLYVICNEGGYDLYVDGTYMLTGDGDGKSGVKLEKGTYTVQLKKDGCDTVTKTVQIDCEHETTLTVTMNCDPCIEVTCEPVCKGPDLWSQKCVDGKCVDDKLVEANSAQCEESLPITKEERALAYEEAAERYEAEARRYENAGEWENAAITWGKAATAWENAAITWGNPTNIEKSANAWGNGGDARGNSSDDYMKAGKPIEAAKQDEKAARNYEEEAEKWEDSEKSEKADEAWKKAAESWEEAGKTYEDNGYTKEAEEAFENAEKARDHLDENRGICGGGFCLGTLFVVLLLFGGIPKYFRRTK